MVVFCDEIFKRDLLGRLNKSGTLIRHIQSVFTKVLSQAFYSHNTNNFSELVVIVQTFEKCVYVEKHACKSAT